MEHFSDLRSLAQVRGPLNGTQSAALQAIWARIIQKAGAA